MSNAETNVVNITNEVDVVLIANYGVISEMHKQSFLFDYGAKIKTTKCECDDYDCQAVVEEYTYTIDKSKCAHLHDKYEEAARRGIENLYMYTLNKSAGQTQYEEVV